MNFRKLGLTAAIAIALAGCGADDQAYEYLDKDVNQTTTLIVNPSTTSSSTRLFFLDTKC